MHIYGFLAAILGVQQTLWDEETTV